MDKVILSMFFNDLNYNLYTKHINEEIFICGDFNFDLSITLKTTINRINILIQREITPNINL